VVDALLISLDWLQAKLARIGIRFQWPCWMLSWAWDRRARLDCPAEPDRDSQMARLSEDGN
jgi:hypothetical protein